MVETKIKFEEVPLTTIFASKRFLLEATVEKKLPDMSFADLLTEVRAERHMTRRQTNVTALLRTHKPVMLVKFVGLRKYSAEWWAAIVRVYPMIKAAVRETDLLLIGWANNHGVEAVCISSGNPTELLDDLEARVLKKTENDYALAAEFKEITLGTGTAAVPEIEGLPDPDPMEELGEWLAPTPPDAEYHPDPPIRAKARAKTKAFLLKKEEDPEAVEVKPKVPKEKTKPISKAAAKRRQEQESFKEIMGKRKVESDW